MQDTPHFSQLRQELGLSMQQVAEQTGRSMRSVHRWEHGASSPRSAAMATLLSVAEKAKEKKFTFADLFAGIGGFRIAFESVGGSCVFTSEWDGYCQKTYRANFDCPHPIEGDISLVDAEDIPEHDVLVGGFPCQPFSIAGVSKKNALNMPHGFECETQGTLFFEIARIIKSRRPQAFLLENVKNLLSHDRGRTFGVIKRTLEEELGYHVSCKVLDARRWVPQHRERIFLVGFRDAVNFSFGETEKNGLDERPTLGRILHPEDGSEEAEDPYTCGKLAKVSPRYTLTSHLWNYLQEYAKKHKLKGNGFGYGLFGRDDVARTISARYYKDGSEVLIRQKGRRPRRLTPRECARLMGFDSAVRGRFVIPTSDTRAYRQFGNAVVVPVAAEVAKLMVRHLRVADRRTNGRGSDSDAPAAPLRLKAG